MTLTAETTHQTAETRAVEAAGVDFAYRSFRRPTGRPLILLQIRIDDDATHGFIFQYPAKAAADVNAFLTREEGSAGP